MHAYPLMIIFVVSVAELRCVTLPKRGGAQTAYIEMCKGDCIPPELY